MWRGDAASRTNDLSCVSDKPLLQSQSISRVAFHDEVSRAVRILFDLPAKLGDIATKGPFAACSVSAPNGRDESIRRKESSRAARELAENLVLERSEVQLAAVDEENAPVRVESQTHRRRTLLDDEDERHRRRNGARTEKSVSIRHDGAAFEMDVVYAA